MRHELHVYMYGALCRTRYACPENPFWSIITASFERFRKRCSISVTVMAYRRLELQPPGTIITYISPTSDDSRLLKG